VGVGGRENDLVDVELNSACFQVFAKPIRQIIAKHHQIGGDENQLVYLLSPLFLPR